MDGRPSKPFAVTNLTDNTQVNHVALSNCPNKQRNDASSGMGGPLRAQLRMIIDLHCASDLVVPQPAAAQC